MLIAHMNFKIPTKLNIALLLVLILVITIVYISISYKLFSPIKVEKEISFGSGTLLFIPYQGDYTKIGGKFDTVKKEISAELGKNITYFGIYYDNPCGIENKNEARAIIGGYFTEEIDLKPFLKKHPNFKTISFTNMKGFGARFPLYSTINMYSAIIRGYTVIYQFGVENKLLADNPYSIELYDYNTNTMTIAFLDTTENESILHLSGYPTPKMKASILKKNE